LGGFLLSSFLLGNLFLSRFLLGSFFLSSFNDENIIILLIQY
jgi:hypothetical protein